MYKEAENSKIETLSPISNCGRFLSSFHQNFAVSKTQRNNLTSLLFLTHFISYTINVVKYFKFNNILYNIKNVYSYMCKFDRSFLNQFSWHLLRFITKKDS